MSERFDAGRHAGALVPLFSIPSAQSWGIGEIPDLATFARWLSTGGLDIVQLLPVNEMADGQNSPYSALSAMAIDPVYIALASMDAFVAGGGEESLRSGERAALEQARRAPAVEYASIRAIKSRVLKSLFQDFHKSEASGSSAAGAALREFMEREAWWLDDYALFRALRQENGGRYWREWDAGVRDREPAALDAARKRLSTEILYRSWLQWIADTQWQQARHDCGPVGIFGDFPFMVSADSADVWSRQHEFRLDASVGVPPDAFSETGQDWGLPVYRWDVIEVGSYEWLRQRARRCAELFDGFRVDHLVGFYRTFVRERDGATQFLPADEPSQTAQGERLLTHFRDSGSRIIAEDLGVVPDFVRASLARLGVPGMKVLRWEREWDEPEQPFREPSTYPRISVATTGTHDTDTLAQWWDAAEEEERVRAARLQAMREAGCRPADPFGGVIRDALLASIFSAASDLVLVPVQDIFGWRDRVNTPAVVDEVNWTWRLPWPVEHLLVEPVALERAAWLRRLTRARGGGS